MASCSLQSNKICLKFNFIDIYCVRFLQCLKTTYVKEIKERNNNRHARHVTALRFALTNSAEVGRKMNLPKGPEK